MKNLVKKEGSIYDIQTLNQISVILIVGISQFLHKLNRVPPEVLRAEVRDVHDADVGRNQPPALAGEVGEEEPVNGGREGGREGRV